MRIELRGKDHHALDHHRNVTDLCVKGPTGLDDLMLIGDARDLRLNGNYQVTVRLTKDEIADLARVAFEGDSFAAVIDVLSKKRTDQ